MKLHELKPAEGSRKVRNRVGRGAATGNGKTSGRGQKGQKRVQVVVSDQDLKVDNYLYSAVYQNEVLLTLTAKNMLLLT